MIRLAIISTHPIQYYAPIFRELSAQPEITLKVFYTWSQSQQGKYDPGFGKSVNWDIPLLGGYDYTFVKNEAKNPTSDNFWGIYNPTIIREITDWNPDALLVFSWSYRSNITILRHFKGKTPIFFRGDSHLLDEVPGLKTRLRRLVLYWVYKHIDYVFYVGENNRQYFLKHGVKPNQLLYAPHVVDNARFQESASIANENAVTHRRQLNIPKEATTFLYAAKLESKKDPDLLLRSFVELDNSEAYLIMVGNGPLEPELKRRYADHPRVRFINFQNQSLMPSVYRLGDVFVLPSQGPAETWGLAVNEAMASGKPVIASDKVGCAVDLISDGMNGYVFKAGSEQSLKETLQKAIDQKDNLPAMGAEASRTVENWSIQVLVPLLVNGLMKAVDKKPVSV